MNRIPDAIEKKKFLMDLIMKGKYEKEEVILGCKVIFRALDDIEITESQKEASGFDIVSRVYIVRKAELARALVSIAFDGSGDWRPESIGEARIFFDKLAPSMVEVFFRKYETISKFRDLTIEEALGVKAEGGKEDILKN